MNTTFARFTSLILIIFLFVQAGTSQQGLTYMPGEFLLKLEPDKDIHSVIKENSETSQFPFTVTVVEQVSDNFNIWLIRTSGNIPPHREILLMLKSWKDVLIAQQNNVGTFREKIPNDADFNRQWFFKNTGQDEGTAGADIKATEAWEIVTGGVTMFGDTIVVAVIDNGFEAGHLDLESNMWYNHAEIPNNQIDDDGNGYVDDFAGWNATNDNGDIYSSQSHGMLVNGMVGAKGNNGQGVTGINWDVKIMNVRLRDIKESDVIKAYNYILSQRKRYNATNGAEGAFVVATNSSWGIDQGKPEDAPIWCDFYDSLGVHGILSCGATANFNFNIDVVGDLPTGCASDYLISVTSSTRNDTKSVAGFGKTTIDLAAPGQSIYSTHRQNSYGGSSGTSFASPLVAGMIGLMYSAECKGFQELVKRNPGEAALKIKELILDNVDKLPNFEQLTLSGGRLNAANAMNALLTQCRSCPTPEAPELLDSTESTLSLQWPDNDLYEAVVLRYREEGSAIWEEVTLTSNNYQITNLLTCTIYEVLIEGVCIDENSDPSESRFFKTAGCCEAPGGIDSIFVQPNAARIIWDPVLPAVSYIFEYKKAEDNIWINLPSDDTQELIRFLDFCTEYEVRVAAVCNADTTNFSDVFEFRTKGCGSCTEKVHCDVPAGNNDLKYISRVSIAGVDINSGAGSDGYESFTASDAFALEVGLSYPIEIEFNGSDTTAPVHIRAWLDYNHDAVFDEEEEVVVSRDSFERNLLRETLNIASRGRIGTTRLRIAILDADLNDSLPVACPGAAFAGDYEDYCITLLQRNCPRAPALDTTMVGFTSISFEWEQAPAIIGFTYRFKKSSDMDWMEEVSDTATSASFSGLTMCEFYDFEIRTICEFDTTLFQRLTIQTQCPTATNEIDPTKLNIQLYPNPIQDMIIIHAESQKNQSVSLNLYSITGNLILSKTEQLSPGASDIQWLGMSRLMPGMYVLQIQTDDGTLSKKVIKQ